MKKIVFFLCAIFLASRVVGTDLVWNSPTTLSTPGQTVSEPQVVMDPSGNITAAWIENGFIKANSLPFGGSWGTAATLSGSGASFPRLGVSSNGNARAVWLEGGIVRTANKPLGNSWTSSTMVSDILGGASTPQLAVNAGNDGVIVWARSGIIEASTKASGAGSWSLPSSLSLSGSDTPQVAINTASNAIVIWHNLNGATHSIVSSSAATLGSWAASKNVAVGSGGLSHHFPKVALDTSGNASALWFRYNQSETTFTSVSMLTSSLTSGASTWGVPTVLTTGGMRDPNTLMARINYDTSGNAIALWTSSSDGETFNLESATKTVVQGVWSPATQLFVSNLYTLKADLSVNTLNGAVALFMNHESGSINIQSAESDIDGVLTGFWSGFTTLSSGDKNGFPKGASALVGSDIQAAAVWINSDGMNNTIQVATGSRVVVAAPTSLTATQNVTDFGVFQDYYNTISWQASTSPNIAQYNIYRNGVLSAQVSATTFQFIDNNQVQGQAVTYGVSAVDNTFSQSPIATVNYP